MTASFLQLTAQALNNNNHDFTMDILLLPAAATLQNNNNKADNHDDTSTEEVHCPITHEPIGSKTYCPPGSKTEGEPLLTHPKYAHLLCMQIMECKHCFDARALVAHFLHNGMTCPLCRHGNSKAILDPKTTFKNLDVSPWVLQYERPSTNKRRRIMVGSLMAAMLLFDGIIQETVPSSSSSSVHLELTVTLMPPSSSTNTSSQEEDHEVLFWGAF